MSRPPSSHRPSPSVAPPSARPRAGLALLASVVLATLLLGASACSETEVVPNLHLRISSEAPVGGGTLDGLGIVLRKGTTRFPADLSDPAFNPALAGLDPVKGPVLISLKYDGQTFGDGRAVSLQVVGRVGQAVKTRVERTVDLGTDTIIELRLLAIGADCDKDGDGFLDCSVAGCCAVGSPFADCNDGQVAINPWGSAPACIPCGSTFDYDCDGTVERCVDADGDTIADCLETECGLGDPTVGPGLPELCDGKDNNCDGSTDEGFELGGAKIGEACTVTGECGAGVVECATTSTTRCSSGPGGSQSKAAAEVCDGKDNDCDGSTDEDFTYEGAAIGQACEGRGECGAGIVECSSTNDTRATCSTNADGSASEAQPEVCDGKDNDCDGNMDEGLTVADSDCVQVGVCLTNRHLIVATCNANGTWSCNYAGVTGWQAVETLCDGLDNDCDGDTDEGFTYQGAAVGEACDGRGECGAGVVVCANGRTDVATCSTNPTGNNSQATAEICDGKDNDCDGDTDEGFSYFAVPIGGQCDGVGECGAGTVVCAVGRTDLATCSTNPNGTASQAIPELCDGKDNDCDGETDETFDVTTNNCKNQGVCATGVVATCNTDGSWTCDYSGVANYQAVETLCDGLDNDCDGDTDEGYTYLGLAVGATCDGVGACGAGTVVCAVGRDDLATCSTNPNGPNSQASAEVCDGADNDCDGDTDEGFTYLGTVVGQVCDGVGECGAGVVECAVGRNDLATCSTNPNGSASQAVAEICDAKDNDCDGTPDNGLTLADSDCKQVGVCAAALNQIVATCTAQGNWTCNYAAVPDYQANETLCDSKDNDCDGSTDEGYTYLGTPVGAACDGVGECGAGVVECAVGRTDLATCSTNPNGSSSQAATEICDDKDNDCDGSTDEGFLYLGTAVGQPCDGVGECGMGLVECLTTTSATCSTNPNGSEPEDLPEVCDGLDNDCDGTPDDGLTLADSTCKQVGVCAAALQNIVATCTMEGVWTCDYSAVPFYEADEVSCDSRDNDCDSATDEGFLYNSAPIGQPCDGIGVCGAGLVECAVGVSDRATCSTNPDGSDTDATTEVCDGLDNDCDGDTDEGFPDTDDDGIADCVDDCLDLDGDSICVTPGLPPCVGGQTTNCSDNCPNVSNPSQADADRDGIGDLCDLACPNGPTPFDVCGDCIDNNCAGGIDETGCVERRIITIQAKTEPLAAGYPVKLVLDHQTLVAAGFSQASGEDVRIFWRDRSANCDDADPLSCYVELDRVTDPLKPFNRTDTEIWFALQDDLDVGEATLDYEIYYNVDSMVKPPQDERAVFQFADLFERGPTDTLGLGWNEPDQAESDFAIANGRLVANYSGDDAFTPLITRTFDPISAAGLHGVYELRIGMNWLRNTEASWAVLMQLGKGSALSGMPLGDRWPNAGVGVSLAHGGGASLGNLAVNTVATVDGGISATPIFSSRGTLSTAGEIVVTIDFDSLPAPLYSVTHAGSIGEDLPALFATDQTELDTLRIVLHNVSSNFTSKAWDYLVLRPKVSALAEPDLYLGVKEPFGQGQATCQLGPNQFLRYRMNEPATNPEITELTDSSGVGAALVLTREQASGSPTHALALGHWSVRFATRATTARYRSATQSSTSKLGTNVGGATRLTAEVVVDNKDTGSRTGSVDWLAIFGNTSSSPNIFGLGFVDRDTIEARVRTTGDIVFRWDVSQLPQATRVVLHLVFDSTLDTESARLRLYYNGAIVAPSVSGAIAGGATLNLYPSTGGPGSDGRLAIGNATTSPSNSPLADIFWFAAYSRALSAEDVKKHTRILLKDDDAP